MTPGDSSAFGPTAAGRRSALIVTTAAYADPQLAWLRPPVSGAGELAAALAAPAAGFAVDQLADGTEPEVQLAIARFLAGRTADETVLLYLSCHAIRDRARLYFAASNTWLRYPQRGAVAATSVIAELAKCRAGNRVLILDCCFAGGFADDKGELDLTAELALDGLGIAVLSGSRAREYSYEGLPVVPELPGSLFTAGLAEGLATRAADANGDGIITLAEAYNYAYWQVRRAEPRQAPQYYLQDGHGEIVLAGGMASAAVTLTAGAPAFDASGLAVRGFGSSAAGVPAFGSSAAGVSGFGSSGAVPAFGTAASGLASAGPAASGTAVADAPPGGAAPVVEQDKDNAYCVAFSPDGTLLASGGWGRPVRIRDVTSGALIRELRAAGPSAYDLAFSPDGALVVTGGRDGTLALSEAATGKRTRSRRPGASAVRAVTFSPAGGLLVSAHEDGVLRLWDSVSLGRARELRADGETVFGAAFSRDGTLLAAACADGTIRLWHAGDGTPLAAFRWHTGWATGVAFSPDGATIVSSGADGTIQLHDAWTGEPWGVMSASEGIVNTLALSPDGGAAAGAYETGAVIVWELSTGRHDILRGHSGFTNDVAFGPDGRTLASAGKDGSVRLWR